MVIWSIAVKVQLQKTFNFISKNHLHNAFKDEW